MSKFNINSIIKWQQNKRLAWCLSIGGVLFICVLLFVIDLSGSDLEEKNKKSFNLTGVVDESFTEANSDSALINLQSESKDLSKLIRGLTNEIQSIKVSHKEQLDSLKLNFKDQIAKVKKESAASNKGHAIQNNQLWHNRPEINNSPFGSVSSNKMLPAQNNHTEIEHMKWTYKSSKANLKFKRNAKNYVTSGTFAKAVILGGADADASVNGQTNSSVMLFKIISKGTLPNGRRSHLGGCFLTASTYGDISSERAYVKLDKISCAHKGSPIIDKSVAGWAFFGGKVGIKGKPLMRDGKILTWAGVSGALSGFASAAQMTQSVQSISALGSTSTVPTGKVFSSGAFAGASSALDRLSNYYIKRADQYHPVIQVGSGNVVTIVFKEGFYLEPEDLSKEVVETEKTTHSKQAFFDPNTYQTNQALINKVDSTAKLGQTIKGQSS